MIDRLLMISELSNANGVSGFEDEVLDTVRRFVPENLEISEDCMRNLYLRRKDNTGLRPLIQLDAHTDEVGFMVHSIRDNGLLKFIPIGGWVSSNIPAHSVRVRTGDGKYIRGITAAKPPHFLTAEEKTKMPDVSDMSIDVGAASAKEARDVFGIRIGAPVVPDVSFEYDDKRDLMFGKAFDNRLGCAAVLATLEALADEALNLDVTAALASQEEVGLRGSAVTAARIKPDIAIVFEGCPADDTVVPPCEVQTAIHKGPMLRHIDARMITNPRYQRFALDLGTELGIPVQESVRSGGSTNGAQIQLYGQGVPVIVIGLPVRYIHSHYGIASMSDFNHAVSLACAVIRKLDEKTIRSF